MQSDTPLLQSSNAYGGLRQPIAQPLLYQGRKEAALTVRLWRAAPTAGTAAQRQFL
ncbi:MAG: hypothetical protein V7L29_07245 [Nostoc sp.]|uniref:hypothetical protein n=1 Tax=Nostoc sp. TaxID=1180 RepID=UPI002FF17AED